MDDIKIHAPTKKSAELIASNIKKTAEAIGLLVNV